MNQNQAKRLLNDCSLDWLDEAVEIHPAGSEKKKKKSSTGKEPQPEEFTSHEAFSANWAEWRRARDENNRSVRKSRQNAGKASAAPAQQTNVDLEAQLAALRSEVSGLHSLIDSLRCTLELQVALKQMSPQTPVPIKRANDVTEGPSLQPAPLAPHHFFVPHYASPATGALSTPHPASHSVAALAPAPPAAPPRPNQPCYATQPMQPAPPSNAFMSPLLYPTVAPPTHAPAFAIENVDVAFEFYSYTSESSPFPPLGPP